MAGLNNFVEPNNIIFGITMPGVDTAVERLKSPLPIGTNEADIVQRTREKRIERIDALNSTVDSGVSCRFSTLNIFLITPYVRFKIYWKLANQSTPIGDMQYMLFAV